MSGGYTHITLAQLAIEEVRNSREGGLHHDAKRALGNWKKFCIYYYQLEFGYRDRRKQPHDLLELMP